MSATELKLLEQLYSLLEPGASRGELLELVDELQPYDLYMILQQLPRDRQLLLLELIPPEKSAEILEHFEPVDQYGFLDNLKEEAMINILNQMSSDEVVQLFAALHPKQVEMLFPHLENSFQEQIRKLMSYPEDTAGSMASIEYVASRLWWTADEVLAHLRKVGDKAEIYNYIYVLGSRGELVGIISLRELILSHPATPVEEIMNTKLITVEADQDQEEAARMLAHYDLVAIPVVSSTGKMVGVITVDDILDILEEEATEDIQLLGGSQPLVTPYLQSKIFGVFSKRIVWLLMLFVAGAITGNILQHYEGILDKVIALTFFIPLLIDTGGNAGAQTCTTVIRAMVVGEVTMKNFLQVIWREMRLGLILGLAMAAVGFSWAMMLQSNDVQIALTVSLTIITVVTVSSTIGAIMPVIGKRLGLDPAVFSAPMITTVVDAVGLIIYFQFARIILIL